MECEEVIRLILEYLDGELHEDQHVGVSEHLEECRSCFSRAEFERRLKGHLAELGHESVPMSFEERIRSLIREF
jgi:mycothiol system anti-sigma-R factor